MGIKPIWRSLEIYKLSPLPIPELPKKAKTLPMKEKNEMYYNSKYYNTVSRKELVNLQKALLP